MWSALAGPMPRFWSYCTDSRGTWWSAWRKSRTSRCHRRSEAGGSDATPVLCARVSSLCTPETDPCLSQFDRTIVAAGADDFRNRTGSLGRFRGRCADRDHRRRTSSAGRAVVGRNREVCLSRSKTRDLFGTSTARWFRTAGEDRRAAEIRATRTYAHHRQTTGQHLGCCKEYRSEEHTSELQSL